MPPPPPPCSPSSTVPVSVPLSFPLMFSWLQTLKKGCLVHTPCSICSDEIATNRITHTCILKLCTYQCKTREGGWVGEEYGQGTGICVSVRNFCQVKLKVSTPGTQNKSNLLNPGGRQTERFSIFVFLNLAWF